MLQQEQVEEAVYPFLGPARTASDVEQARAALGAAYETAGYPTVSVTVPPQHVDQTGGIIVMRVVERRVERLRVAGSRYFLPSGRARRCALARPRHRAKHGKGEP